MTPACVVNYWPSWFRALVFQDGAWPRSYCCGDVETTGFSAGEDVVTEWGHVLVEDGQVVDRLSMVIDWTGRQSPPDHWLKTRLHQVRLGMEQRGKPYHVTPERMRAVGRKPEEAFAFIAAFTDAVKAKGIPFVLHNHSFDENMLSANFLQFKFGRGFSFGDRLVDTEVVAKASQILDNERAHPRTGDTLRSYYHRVKYTRAAGVKSNLDDYCYAAYGLAARGLDRKHMHGAEADSYACHLLMVAIGEQVGGVEPPPVYPNADSKAAARPPRASPPDPRRTPPPAGLRRIRGVRRS